MQKLINNDIDNTKMYIYNVNSKKKEKKKKQHLPMQ